MNKDQGKGTVKNLAGHVQEEAGKLVGSAHQQVKGVNKQSEGKAKKNLGDVKEVVKDHRGAFPAFSKHLVMVSPVNISWALAVNCFNNGIVMPN